MGDTLEVEKPYLRLAGMIAGNLGVLHPDVVRYYLSEGRGSEIPAALLRGFDVPLTNLKFALLRDLGVITVPDDYDHATFLGSFLARNSGRLSSFTYAMSDENFSDPLRVMKPGDQFRVRIFKQIVHGSTTIEERVTFLRGLNAIFTGVQGGILVLEQFHDGRLPRGYFHCSFTGKDMAVHGREMVRVSNWTSGKFGFDVYYHGEKSMGSLDTIMSFHEVDPNQMATSLSSISAGGS